MSAELQDQLFTIARTIREKEEVAPIVFFDTEPGLVPMLLNVPKEQWRQAICTGLRRTGAKTVILHAEAWVAPGVNALSIKLAGGSIAGLPESVEILQSTMECSDGTRRVLSAEIKDGVLGETVVTDYTGNGNLTGNLVGFFS